MTSTGKVNKSMFEQPAANQPPPAKGAQGMTAMFEQKAKDAGPQPIVKKKTWANTGNSGGGNTGHDGKYRGKTKIGDGPPPAKSLTDLP